MTKSIKIENIKLGSMILLEWFDAFGQGAWHTTYDVDEALKNPAKCEIIGYLVKYDENFIVLTMGVQNNSNTAPFMHLEFIPRGCITKIRRIKNNGKK